MASFKKFPQQQQGTIWINPDQVISLSGTATSVATVTLADGRKIYIADNADNVAAALSD